MGGRGSGRRTDIHANAGRKGASSFGGNADANLKAFRRWMEEEDPKDGKKRMLVMFESLYNSAKGAGKGSPPSSKSIAEVFDRLMGRPLQSVAMEITKSREEVLSEVAQAVEYLKEQRDGKPTIQ